MKLNYDDVPRDDFHDSDLDDIGAYEDEDPYNNYGTTQVIQRKQKENQGE